MKNRTQIKYKLIRIGSLFVMLTGIMGYYFFCYISLPSHMKLLSGKEQEIDFHIPATASISTASGKVVSDLYKPVSMKAGSSATYQMDVKLLGVIPLKSVEIQVIDEDTIHVMGQPIGIFIKTGGVMVVGEGSFETVDGSRVEPSGGIIQTGDYIVRFNGNEVSGKKQFLEWMAECTGEPIRLSVERDGMVRDVTIQPERNREGAWKLGIWIRDNAQGVGTLTFIDENGNFGALGHGIADGETGELMELGRGSLYDTTIVGIKKGGDGVPGELTGMIEYDDENIVGIITENTSYGIFGQIYADKIDSFQVSEALPICLKQNIRLGEAQILSGTSGKPEYYTVEITKVHLGEKESKGIELTVTDDRLLSLTGGIVQGMSGSPILQDGKVIGAVTHVLVNDPTRGYGIYIEDMIKH